MEALGRHILVEFFNCAPRALNDVPTIEASMVDAAGKAGATILNSEFHHFSPYGVSGVVIIQESHLAIHTWPEYQYAAADLFTCGDEVDPWLAFDNLKESLDSKNYSVLELHRGPLNLLKRIPFHAEIFRPIVENRLQHFPPKRSMWFTDKDENLALSLRTRGNLLYDKTSLYQRIRVFESFGFGKLLTIDNMVMCSENDEAHYHEMICHPALFSHPHIKNVLVIGGGDGGSVREILRHDSVEKVTMVEIDANVVEAAKLHLPYLSSALDHPKLDLKIDDGIAYVQSSPDSCYDLVIIDGSDPVGPAKGLFSNDFYGHCRRILTDKGVLVAQGESPVFNRDVFIELNRHLKMIYGAEHVHVLLFNIVTYPGGIWSIQLATKGESNLDAVDSQKIADFVKEHKLIYYNAEIHQASQVLPNFVSEMLNSSPD